MSRMFKSITRTWNIWVGCRFDCVYCVARSLALGRLKNSPRYRCGFKPHIVPSELLKTFKPGEFVMVSFMGDLSFAHTGDLELILDRIREFPQTDFLIQTKDPGKFFRWYYEDNIRLPHNVVLGTTLESTLNYGLSKAPPPYNRFENLVAYPINQKFVSIEPVMDFDLEQMVSWVRLIKPKIVEIGADNYNNSLPEPPWAKVEELLERLKSFVPRVVEKEGLERLKGKASSQNNLDNQA